MLERNKRIRSHYTKRSRPHFFHHIPIYFPIETKRCSLFLAFNVYIQIEFRISARSSSVEFDTPKRKQLFGISRLSSLYLEDRRCIILPGALHFASASLTNELRQIRLQNRTKLFSADVIPEFKQVMDQLTEKHGFPLLLCFLGVAEVE